MSCMLEAVHLRLSAAALTQIPSPLILGDLYIGDMSFKEITFSTLTRTFRFFGACEIFIDIFVRVVLFERGYSAFMILRRQPVEDRREPFWARHVATRTFFQIPVALFGFNADDFVRRRIDVRGRNHIWRRLKELIRGMLVSNKLKTCFQPCHSPRINQNLNKKSQESGMLKLGRHTQITN